MAEETPGQVEVECPLCHGRLTVRTSSGAVIDAEAPQKKAKGFDDVLGDLLDSGSRREAEFRKAFENEEHRREILERKFDSARRKAEEPEGSDSDSE